MADDSRLSVSVALCTYNGARFLREQLDSFTNQIRLPDEVIVCDDGSTDATLEILEDWKKTAFFSVNIVKNERNLGYAQNFGKAISLCTKDVIFLSDQDDVWLPEKLDTMVREFETNPEVGVVTSDGFIIDENGTRVDGRAQLLARDWFYDETTAYCVWRPTLKDCYPRGCAAAFRASLRDILLPIPPHWSHDLWLNVIYRLRFQGIILPETLFSYRIYGGNWTQGSFENRIGFIDYKKRIFHWNAASQFMANDELVSEFEERIRNVPNTKYALKCRKYLAENRKHFRNRERIQRNLFLFAPLFLLEVLTLRYFQHFHAWQAIGHDLWIGLKNRINPVKFFKKKTGKRLQEMNFTQGIKRKLSLLFGRDYCPFCGCFANFKPFGTPVRLHAMCPFCGSLERHRFLYNVYRQQILDSKESFRILHTAPESVFSRIFMAQKQIDYVPIDLYPELFPEVPCIKADVTCLPFENGSFDVILSNHVLEHISDERKCLSEFARVLTPEGRIFLTFPVDWNLSETLEDSSIQTPEERLKYYGQADHVRLYGRDVVSRLSEFFRVEKLAEKEIHAFGNQRWNSASYCFILTCKR